MEEIKFRAIATEEYQTDTDGIEKGEFVYGYYYFCKRRMSGIIITELGAESGGVGSGLVQVEIEVDYNTVGQYTGIKDKNKKEIYEGGIVNIYKSLSMFNNFPILHRKEKDFISVVEFYRGRFILYANGGSKENLGMWNNNVIEIIENKFFNQSKKQQ